MWPVIKLLLLLCCTGGWCQDCNRTKSYFKSRNFFTALHWDKVDVPGQDVRYDVWYHKYGEPLNQVPGCQKILDTSCDFSSVMMNIHERYYTKIMVDNICYARYRNFIPSEETTLEAPKVSSESHNEFVIIKLTPPMGPQNRSLRDITCGKRCRESKEPLVTFFIHLTHPAAESGKIFENTSGNFTLNHLERKTNYCGVAYYQFTHPSVKRQSENSTFCVTLPGSDEYFWIYIVAGSALVALLTLTTVSLVFCQLHLRRKRNMPKALVISKKDTPHFYPHPKLEIANVKVGAEIPQNVDEFAPGSCTFLKKSRVNTEENYASQHFQAQDAECHSYANQDVISPENSSRGANSCTSYSIVMGTMVPQEPMNCFSYANDSGIGESISPGSESCPGDNDSVFQDLDVPPDLSMATTVMQPSIDPFKLPVSRDSNGKLHFSSLVFQPLTANLSDPHQITPPVTASTPAEEKAPLLTDLIDTDDFEWMQHSDYGRTYVPNTVPSRCSQIPIQIVSVPYCSSNYRQNWVPGMMPEIATSDDENLVFRSKLLNDFSEAENKGKEALPEISSYFSGGLMV